MEGLLDLIIIEAFIDVYNLTLWKQFYALSF